MTELIGEYVDAFESTIPKPVELQLPKLQLPKLKKVGEENKTPELPKLQLPKLKKVEA